MICINLPSTNPYFNLAAEEYLLKNSNDDVLMLWRSTPSIIVGKHQNMMAEVNYPYVLKSHIPVIRRLSGGGTVFHDLGNVNFSYIANGKDGHIVDFKRFTQPIVDFLNSRAIPAQLSGRNDILVDGFKFSGNAEHVFKNRVLHHGTILFSSNLDSLKLGIAPTGGSYSDNSVKSFRSKVANLQSYFSEAMEVDEFKDLLFTYLIDRHQSTSYSFSEADVERIQALVASKYATWDWNFGYSPDYTFRSIPNADGQAVLQVKKGIICEATYTYADGEGSPIPLLHLVGLAHDSHTEIARVLQASYPFMLPLARAAEASIY